MARLTAAEQLETVELYLRHGDTDRVGAILDRSGASIRGRLKTMGVPLKEPGCDTCGLSQEACDRLEALRTQLRQKVAIDKLKPPEET